MTAVERLKAAQEKRNREDEQRKRKDAQEFAKSAEAEVELARAAAVDEACTEIQRKQEIARGIQIKEQEAADQAAVLGLRGLLMIARSLALLGERLQVPDRAVLAQNIGPSRIKSMVNHVLRAVHGDWRTKFERGARSPAILAECGNLADELQSLAAPRLERAARRMALRRALRAAGCNETGPVPLEAGARLVELVLAEQDPFAKLTEAPAPAAKSAE